jgi:hypothetical protein
MKKSKHKSKFTAQYMSAATIHTPQLPHNRGQIVQKIYRAHGGMMGMTLNDWLEADQELKLNHKQQEHDNL